jgi:hypothetical protein
VNIVPRHVAHGAWTTQVAAANVIVNDGTDTVFPLVNACEVQVVM